MAYYAGSYQSGLPSREAPFIASVTGQSSWQTGLSQVGGFSAAVHAACYRCVARVQALSKLRHKCTAVLALPGLVMIAIEGYVYHANFRAFCAVRAGLAVGGTMLHRVAAVMTQSAYQRHAVTAVLALGVSARYRVTGLCQANYAAVCRITGALKQRLNYRIRTIGILKANHRTLIRVRAVLWQFTAARYRVTGLLGYGVRAAYKTVGALRQTSLAKYQAHGHLANTVGHWFIKVTGNINIAAFVASVPKRVQEFITNKTWFK